jgi:hypothetical protein
MIQEHVRQKKYFLLKAYQGAYEYLPESPLSVTVDPFVLGTDLGFDNATVMRVMQELVSDGYATSGAGYKILMITDQGLHHLQDLQRKFESMKQSEKMDLILRELYEHQSDGLYYPIKEMLMFEGIQMKFEEAFRLAARLKDENLITTLGGHQDVKAMITSKGIDRVEGDSDSSVLTPTIQHNTNYNISNSPNSNIVSGSQNVSIHQEIASAQNIVNEIREKAQSDNSIPQEKLQDILACLSEIETSLKHNQKPKFAIRSLLDISAGIASITSLAIQLGQFAHLVPIPT